MDYEEFEKLLICLNIDKKFQKRFEKIFKIIKEISSRYANW